MRSNAGNDLSYAHTLVFGLCGGSKQAMYSTWLILLFEALLNIIRRYMTASAASRPSCRLAREGNGDDQKWIQCIRVSAERAHCLSAYSQ
ncbi:hypothetical protein PENSPDRAFT_647991 [Peniophora sp. CONT]|nr:hypothetical protein PENSPDRAFT_647991 [Peniophora sp. CONT]